MKKLLFLLLAIMATVAVNAQLVSRQQALEKAQKFMPDKQFVEKSVISSRGDVSGRLDAFYVFNADNNGGFVIVSGDETALQTSWDIPRRATSIWSSCPTT